MSNQFFSIGALLVLFLTFCIDQSTPLAINFVDCGRSDIKRVNLTGCDMSESNENLCVVDRGAEMQLDVDFIPDRDYDNLEAHLVAHINNWVNLDLPGIEVDACGVYLQCPVQGGKLVRLSGRATVPYVLPRMKTRITAKLVESATMELPACGTINVRVR